MSRTSPSGVGRGVPPRFVSCPGANVPGTLGGTGISVGYYGEPVVLRDHGDSGNLYPFSTGGYPACYQCGVASAQCGGIGSPWCGFPAIPGDATGVLSPRCTTPTIGSLVTPSFCLGTSSLCLPVPVCVMCDVSSCALRLSVALRRVLEKGTLEVKLW